MPDLQRLECQFNQTDNQRTSLFQEEHGTGLTLWRPSSRGRGIPSVQRAGIPNTDWEIPNTVPAEAVDSK